MIITRSPLRITLGGGGTDLPSYYEQHDGFLVAAAIDKYVYITLMEMFEPGILLKYSRMERCKSISEVEHPIVREALRMVGMDEHPSLEIASMADIPAGTGLGSSGAFTTALPAFDAFPMAQWARLSAKHWRRNRSDVMVGAGGAAGSGFALLTFVARLLFATRNESRCCCKCSLRTSPVPQPREEPLIARTDP